MRCRPPHRPGRAALRHVRPPTHLRRGRRLVITLRAAAPRAVARVGARRVAVRGGRVRLKGVRAGRLLLRVSAPAGRGTTYRAVRFRITVARGGAVRITRL